MTTMSTVSAQTMKKLFVFSILIMLMIVGCANDISVYTLAIENGIEDTYTQPSWYEILVSDASTGKTVMEKRNIPADTTEVTLENLPPSSYIITCHAYAETGDGSVIAVGYAEKTIVTSDGGRGSIRVERVSDENPPDGDGDRHSSISKKFVIASPGSVDKAVLTLKGNGIDEKRECEIPSGNEELVVSFDDIDPAITDLVLSWTFYCGEESVVQGSEEIQGLVAGETLVLEDTEIDLSDPAGKLVVHDITYRNTDGSINQDTKGKYDRIVLAWEADDELLERYATLQLEIKIKDSSEKFNCSLSSGEYTITGLEEATEYEIAATAMDASGNPDGQVTATIKAKTNTPLERVFLEGSRSLAPGQPKVLALRYVPEDASIWDEPQILVIGDSDALVVEKTGESEITITASRFLDVTTSIRYFIGIVGGISSINVYLPTPTIVSEVAGSSVKLVWDNVMDGAVYTLSRFTSEDGTVELVKDGATTMFLDKDLEPGTEATYSLQAKYVQDGKEHLSSKASLTVTTNDEPKLEIVLPSTESEDLITAPIDVDRPLSFDEEIEIELTNPEDRLIRWYVNGKLAAEGESSFIFGASDPELDINADYEISPQEIVIAATTPDGRTYSKTIRLYVIMGE